MDEKTRKRIEKNEERRKREGSAEPTSWTRETVQKEIEELTAHPELDRPIERQRGRPKTADRNDIVKTNLDLSEPVLAQLDEIARNLNISRQAVIKMWIHEKLVEYRLSCTAHG